MLNHAVPSSPIITSTNAHEKSISIKWSKVQGDRIDYYLIDYSYQDQCVYSPQPTETTNQTELEANLTGLQEFSNYLVNITAVNSQGQNSTTRMITTLSSGLYTYISLPNSVYGNVIAPSGRPQTVSGHALSPTSIHIEWGPVNCLEQNGNIIGYKIHYQPLEYPQLQLSVTATTDEIRKLFTATHLIPQTDYNFNVSALNVNGMGPNGTVVLTTEAVEGEPI